MSPENGATRTPPKGPTVKDHKPQLLDVSKLPVDRAIAALIDRAVTVGASDLFFVTNEQHVAVQVRHLGIVRLMSVLAPETGRRYLAHIKAMAGMDLGGAARRPMDGRWIYESDGTGGAAAHARPNDGNVHTTDANA